MQSKCASISKNSISNGVFSGKMANNSLLNTIGIIVLTLGIFGVLYYVYSKKQICTNSGQYARYIDRFADTTDDKKWFSYDRYFYDNAAKKFERETVDLSPTVQANLDTDRYLAQDSPNPSYPEANKDYSTLNLNNLNTKLMQQGREIVDASDKANVLIDLKSLVSSQQYDNNKLVDVLTDDIGRQLYNKINEQNNMSYQLLLADNYNADHYN